LARLRSVTGSCGLGASMRVHAAIAWSPVAGVQTLRSWVLPVERRRPAPRHQHTITCAQVPGRQLRWLPH
jgi:hypothetical protein